MATATAVLRRARRLGRHRFWFLIRLALVVFVPLGLLGTIDNGITIGEGTPTLVTLGAAAIAAATLIGSLFFAGAMATTIVHVDRGSEPSLRWTLGQIHWRVLITIDLLFVFGTAFGIALLIVPGLIFYGRYVLAAPIADIDRTGVREAFRRSATLTKGHRIAVTAILLGVLAAGEVLEEALVALIEAIFHEGFIVDWSASTLSELVVSPPFALVAVAFVLELRSRAGGTAEPAPPAPAIQPEG